MTRANKELRAALASAKGNGRKRANSTPAEYKATESEASVEARVTQWLTERGYRVHVLVTEVERGYKGRSRRNEAGTPDLIAVRPYGIAVRPYDWEPVLYLELKKAKGGRHSADQVAMQATLRAEGFCVFAHRSDGTDVIEQLEEWAKGDFR